MPVKKSAVVTIYHITNGPALMYEIDAKHALKFKKEWKAKPWKGQEAAEAEDETEEESAAAE